MPRMGHNSTVPIRIHERYLQIIPKFGIIWCEGRGKWMTEYGMLRSVLLCRSDTFFLIYTGIRLFVSAQEWSNRTVAEHACSKV